jgi:cation:H+ antiporter
VRPYPTVLFDLLLIVGGLALLAAGGELLVRGAARLASRFGVSPLVIGLTVVAFGTSAPELAVSLQAALGGSSDLAVGNVIGSNIFNVLVVLGASATIIPLLVSRQLVRVEVPIMIAVSALTVALSADGRIGSLDGALLIGIMAAYSLWLLRSTQTNNGYAEDVRTRSRDGAVRNGLLVLAGLALLVIGARWLVAGAVNVAAALGISQVVIGLTIVAIGTSLPEVATSIIAATRGHRDIAIGNVVGSNIFNLSLILGTTAVVAGPIPVAPAVLTFDMMVMTAVALACLPIFFTGYVIARWEGLLFLTYYIAYTLYLVMDATDHLLLSQFSAAMLFVLPLTGVTLLVLSARAFRRQRGRSRAGTRMP